MKSMLLILISLFFIINIVSAETFVHRSPKKQSVIKKGTECTETNPFCVNGYLAYVKHDDWSTPFNPHKILNTWKVLIKGGNPMMSVVLMGNPKIDWEAVPDDLDPSLAILPEGEKYAIIYFTFNALPKLDNEKIAVNELIVIAYRDLEGCGGIVSHVLKKSRDGYRMSTEKERQDIMNDTIRKGQIIVCSLQ